jgi:hypothetical protein
MALANVAVLLAKNGSSVLAVDFDLEAPGLDRYLQGVLVRDGDLRSGPGLIELLHAAATDGETAEWREHVSRGKLGSGELTILAAGRADESYNDRVLTFDWPTFFAEREGGAFVERLRDEWKHEFDVVLIDSRTGITDTGGVCTIQLPDVLVPVITPNQQSIDGTKDVVERAQAARQELSYDRPPLLVFPLASRFDTRTEFEIAREWLQRLAHEMDASYADWLPTSFAPLSILERTKLPHVAYYSFGEALPVETDSLSDPDTLGYAYRILAELIGTEFANVQQLLGQDILPTAETDRLRARVDHAESKLRALPDRQRDRAWAILTRLVRIDEGDGVSLVRLPASAGEAEAEDVARLRSLGVVDAAPGSIRLASTELAAAWPELHERVVSDRRYLTVMAGVREAAESGTPLDELLGPAIGWYVKRRRELLDVEQRHIELCYDIRQRALERARPPFPNVGRFLIAAVGVVGTVATYLVFGFTIAVALIALFGVTLAILARGRSSAPDFLVGTTRSAEEFLAAAAAEFAVRGLATDAVPDAAVFTTSQIETRARGTALPGPDAMAYAPVHRVFSGDIVVIEGPRSVVRAIARGTNFKAGGADLADKAREFFSKG